MASFHVKMKLKNVNIEILANEEAYELQMRPNMEGREIASRGRKMWSVLKMNMSIPVELVEVGPINLDE